MACLAQQSAGSISRVVLILGDDGTTGDVNLYTFAAPKWPAFPPVYVAPDIFDKRREEMLHIYVRNAVLFHRLARLALTLDTMCMGGVQSLGVVGGGFTAQVRRGDEDEWMEELLEAELDANRNCEEVRSDCN